MPKHSDRQIQTSPIPMESYFTKFNARQTYPLVNMVVGVVISGTLQIEFDN